MSLPPRASLEKAMLVVMEISMTGSLPAVSATQRPLSDELGKILWLQSTVLLI
jgi:hypothetical protein